MGMGGRIPMNYLDFQKLCVDDTESMGVRGGLEVRPMVAQPTSLYCAIVYQGLEDGAVVFGICIK